MKAQARYNKDIRDSRLARFFGATLLVAYTVALTTGIYYAI